jgi:hypothetical protein
MGQHTAGILVRCGGQGGASECCSDCPACCPPPCGPRAVALFLGQRALRVLLTMRHLRCGHALVASGWDTGLCPTQSTTLRAIGATWRPAPISWNCSRRPRLAKPSCLRRLHALKKKSRPCERCLARRCVPQQHKSRGTRPDSWHATLRSERAEQGQQTSRVLVGGVDQSRAAGLSRMMDVIRFPSLPPAAFRIARAALVRSEISRVPSRPAPHRDAA